MQSYKIFFVTLPLYMVKKTLLTLVSLLSLLLIMSCEGKTKTPKVLHIPTAIVTVDTLARLSDDMQCHVHVDFTYLKGKNTRLSMILF